MGQEQQSDQSTEGKSTFSAPSISLPKGGGAIRGIGEKFGANPVTGTGSLSVPLALSPGRSGFGPQLSLSYDSGAGNGPFGFGWSLGLPSITRKTDKGLPCYLDGKESDVFILSGAEDLVPVLLPDGRRPQDDASAPGYAIRRYRPRVEGLFARIERWTRKSDGDVHWRSISKDNVTTLYGKTAASRIADPADSARAFSWLICESWDDKGNATVYEYAAENDDNIDRAQANERNRLRTANRYLKRIQYGNRQSRLVQPDLTKTDWLFEAVFDYDEGHYEKLDLDAAKPEAEQHRFVRAAAATAHPWSVRPDPFSSHRSGFEIRTYRRCRRVLMFHRFAELGGEPCLVRSTELDYEDLDYSQPAAVETELAYEGSTRFASFIRSVTQSGFVRDTTKPVMDRDDVKYVTYLEKSMPPLEFEYSQAAIQDNIRELDAASLENLPVGLDGAAYQWVDLDGEGLSGILTEQAGAWFYKPNLGGGRFGPLEEVVAKPSLADLSGGGRQQLLDLAGDGQLDLVAFSGATPGFYERTHDEDWEEFRTFRRLPDIRWDEPNLRFVDLNGDGHADVLITEDDVFTWYPSLAEEGFGPANQVRQPRDEERGPRLVLADGTQSIHLADMCGDGLTDLVRVRNGEVCYWPNLGYGRFGAKVAMDAAPWFDAPDQFDHERVRLADIDGSGVTDILYLGRDGARVYFNQSGNRWSGPRRLGQFPRTDNLSSVMTADLLGNGTACLVWSSPLPGSASRSLRYIDLMGGQKPHLLVRSINNLGAETRVHYASSTKFYLADKLAGKPWITKLPFPVHVVERIETYDWIGRSRFATRYAYHHGYFDGQDREFRGFGRVEQWDTEEQRGDTAFPEAANWNAASWTPPMRTCTWFHTGAFLEAGAVSRQYAREYWTEPALRGDDRTADREAMLLADTVLPAGLTLEETSEACRALKGMALRIEVYAEDGSLQADNPYSVTEQNFTVRREQPTGGNRHAVFFVHPREKVSFHYERQPADPRAAHEVTLEVDPYGNVLRSVTLGYPRRPGAKPEPDLSEAFQARLAYDQARLHIAATENRFTQDTLTDPVKLRDIHRTPLPAETIAAELTGIAPAANRPGITNLFRLDELDAHWKKAWEGKGDIPYEEIPGADVDGGGSLPTALTRRIVEHTRTVYRRDDLTALLPLGELESLALPGDSYRLALTPGLIQRVFGARVPDSILAEGGYVKFAGGSDWWMPSGRIFYSAGDTDTAAAESAEAGNHFYQPRRFVDAFGAVTRVAYSYDLLVERTEDPVGNVMAAANDFRVLQPSRLTDANGNRTENAFDALGLVTGTAVRGKTTENLGDSLDGFVPDLDEATVLAHLADPLNDPGAILGKASTRLFYDLFAYSRTRNTAQPIPAAVYTLLRETHVSELPAGAETRYQHSLHYSDGFGREIQRKIQAEPGPLAGAGADVSPRWVGSGWTLFNNKGKPVRKYEPFFSATHRFEFARQEGVSSVLFYDPAERVVATLHPNETWEKVVFYHWRQETWDVNDTVKIGDPRRDEHVGGYFQRFLGGAPDAFKSWHDRRIDGNFGATPEERTSEKDSAEKTAKHAATPAVVNLDTLGRTCLAVAHNGGKERHATRTVLDAEGKPLAVFDALGRRVVEHCLREPLSSSGFRYVSGYDLAGNPIYRNAMDGGERRTLANAAGKPLRSWDALTRAFRLQYDKLQRPTHLYVSIGGAAEILLERSVYGEGMADRNLCGRLHRHYDGAGVAIHERHDFKGNLVQSVRQLAREYRQAVDWSALKDLNNDDALDAAASPLLIAADRYTSVTFYDALNRPIQTVAPHRTGMRPSVLRPSYNEANFVETIDVWARRASPPTTLLEPVTADLHTVTDIDYNARGQRILLALGNGTVTNCDYDPLTFRLARLVTTRPSSFGADKRVVQDLAYTYDPAGNITRIRDTADIHNVIYFNNQRVEPSSDYEYDSLYKLIRATGREHLGQSGSGLQAPEQIRHDDSFRMKLPHPSDGKAMGAYRETYTYDPVGNLLTMMHQVSSGSWTRRYSYTEKSRITSAETCNRLSSTSLPGDPDDGPYTEKYDHDDHGNMIRMPHLSKLTWNEQDRLRSTVRQVTSGAPETAYYIYDSTSQRIRKVTDRTDGTPRIERLYLGGIEIYREIDTDGKTVKLERETLHVMGGSDRLALIETRTAGTDPAPAQLIRYQHTNHLGSALLELDDKAKVISYEEYFPYGSTAYQAVRDKAESPKRYRYTGKERDEESDLYYHGARYYAAWLGRWTSPDPEGTRDGLNLYAYVRGNPLRLFDPTGTRSVHSEHGKKQPKPNWQGKALFLSETRYKDIVEVLREEGKAIKFIPFKKNLVAHNWENKTEKISVPDLGILQFDTNTPEPMPSSLLGLLRDVILSKHRVLFTTAIERKDEKDVTFEQLRHTLSNRRIESQLESRAAMGSSAGQTRLSLDIQKATYRSLLKPGEPVSFTSKYKDLSIITLRPPIKDLKLATLKTAFHELAHFFLAIHGAPSGHTEKVSLAGKGILKANGEPFTGTAEDFIRQQIEPQVLERERLNELERKRSNHKK